MGDDSQRDAGEEAEELRECSTVLSDDCLLYVMLLVEDCTTLACMAACCTQWRRVAKIARTTRRPGTSRLHLTWRLTKEQSRPRNSCKLLKEILQSSPAVESLDMWLPIDRQRSKLRKERMNNGRSRCLPALKAVYDELGCVLSESEAILKRLCLYELQEDEALESEGWRKAFDEVENLVRYVVSSSDG